PAADLENQARRLLEICNACRYCEGYCAVFPAMELRRHFTSGDLSYLANLCHDCRACYYACPFTPPHEFALNPPQIFARLRAESYRQYAWPGSWARLFQRNGTVVSLTTSLAIAFLLMLSSFLHSEAGAPHRGPGAFYAVIPEYAMVGVTGVAL